MKSLRLLIAALFVALAALAVAGPLPGLDREAFEWDVDGLEPLLPRHATEAERLYWQPRLDEMPAAATR